ncbi:MAG: 5'-methylthioadenosine/adenosylhomocysteine nucleosidase [Lachnospiraceae bacterium]|nr:5'-methylthioadenosine/adenosylhomocysteine nucleosidase [Lachnospiraceae bacterium]
MLGIIGAMEEEVESLLKEMQDYKERKKAGMIFYAGTLCGKEVIIVKSGIGKVNMAMCTQILIDDFKVDKVINTGVAGGLHSDIEIGDIVVSIDALQHDVDCSVFGDPIGTIPRMDCSVFPADKEMVRVAKEACEKVNPEIKCLLGRVVSGDQFIESAEKKAFLVEQFAPYCAEMEGAAMAHVAYLNQVPFVIIRAISDKADNSAQMNYEEFKNQAIIHTVRLVKEFVATMSL